jgi:hypothetical protein
MNPLEFFGGRGYMGRSNMLIGPVPWAHFAAYVFVGALFIVTSVKIVERGTFEKYLRTANGRFLGERMHETA